jgi:hypothetical protein
VGRAGARVSREVRDVTEMCSRARPARAARTRSTARRVPRRLPPRARAGRRQPPRDLLRSIPGVELLPLAEQESAAAAPASTTSSMPATGRELGERKAALIDATRPDIVAPPPTPGARCRSPPPPDAAAGRGRSAIRSRFSMRRFGDRRTLNAFFLSSFRLSAFQLPLLSAPRDRLSADNDVAHDRFAWALKNNLRRGQEIATLHCAALAGTGIAS